MFRIEASEEKKTLLPSLSFTPSFLLFPSLHFVNGLNRQTARSST